MFLLLFCSSYSWLKEWKKRADWEEKRNQKGEKEDKVHEGADRIHSDM